MSEFKNENLNVKVERLPGAQIKFDMSITKEATKAAYEKAIKNITKEIVIPGFRKGKAPKNLVLEKFKSAIDEEWRSVLLNTAFHEALEIVKVIPFSQESIKPQIKNISLETGSEITITFEQRPEVPEINPSEIKLKKVSTRSVTDKDIEERMTELQLHQATWEDINDRGVQEGDFVHLDIESLDNPGTVVCKDQPFSVIKGKIGNWLHDLLLNKNVKDVFEGTSQKDPCHECEDHTHVHPKEEEFKPSKLQITIQAIKKPVLPEITTEFASKLGAESVEKLKERVILSLEKNFKEEAQEKLRNQLEEIVLQKYQFDIPASILKSHGKLPEKEMEELKDSYRIYLMSEKIAHNLKLDVTQDEIMQEFMVQAYMTNPENSFIDPSADPKEIHHRIRSYLLEKKVKDYLIEHAHKE